MACLVDTRPARAVARKLATSQIRTHTLKQITSRKGCDVAPVLINGLTVHWSTLDGGGVARRVVTVAKGCIAVPPAASNIGSADGLHSVPIYV